MHEFREAKTSTVWMGVLSLVVAIAMAAFTIIQQVKSSSASLEYRLAVLETKVDFVYRYPAAIAVTAKNEGHENGNNGNRQRKSENPLR